MDQSTTIVDRSPTTRSAVSNGSQLFVDNVDGRSKEARRFRDVLAEIISDLGGADGLSEGQRQLARRCALMSVECERMEAKSVAGEAIDLDVFGQLSDRIGRAFQRLGLRRVKRVINDGSNVLADYFSKPLPKDGA
jgi:hypothetical protein